MMPNFGYDPETKTYEGDAPPPAFDERHRPFREPGAPESPMGPNSVMRKGMSLIEQREAAGKEEEQALIKKQQAEAPYQKKLQEIYASPVTAHAELKKMQEAPRPEDYKKYTMEFLGAMALVGAFAGKGSRNHGNAALKAFTGAMNGWQQGNLEAYAQATKQWEENARATIQANQVELQRYREIIENRDLDIERWKAGMMLAGLQAENQAMIAHLRANNIDAAIKDYSALVNADAKLQRSVGWLGHQNTTNEKQLVQQASEIQFNGGKQYLDALHSSGQMDDTNYRHYQWVLENYGPGTEKAKQVGGDPERAAKIGDAIIAGKQSPDLKGLYRNQAEVRAYLQDRGFNLQEAQLEWTRAQKQAQSLSGPQMIRYVGLNQDVQRVIDRVLELSDKLDQSGITALNKAELAAEVNLRGNTPGGQLAAQYIAQITVLKEAFSNLANGGYAPTIPAFKLADRAVNENYGRAELKASLEEIRRSISYRLKAIPGMETMGPGAPNRYVPGGNASQPQGDAAGGGESGGGTTSSGIKWKIGP